MANEPKLFDRDLSHLPPELRWREWMNRVEAAIFASDVVIPKEQLQLVVSADVNLDELIDDIQAELTGRPYSLVAVPGGWMHQTRPEYADAIRAAADMGEGRSQFNQMEMAVMCAIAYHQPISRAGLAELFSREINRDLLSRLKFQGLIANGPRAPMPGAPHTFVTTDEFLITFGLQSLRDLPELENPMEEGELQEGRVIYL